MKIGPVIRDFRLKKSLRQGELAAKTNISQTYLSLIETDKRLPEIETIKKLAHALDVPLPILLFLTLDESYVPDGKKELYLTMKEPLKNIMSQVFL